MPASRSQNDFQLWATQPPVITLYHINLAYPMITPTPQLFFSMLFVKLDHTANFHFMLKQSRSWEMISGVVTNSMSAACLASESHALTISLMEILGGCCRTVWDETIQAGNLSIRQVMNDVFIKTCCLTCAAIITTVNVRLDRLFTFCGSTLYSSKWQNEIIITVAMTMLCHLHSEGWQ